MARCARDLMQTKVQSVDPDLPLAELERAFMEARVTGFPVVSHGKLVGVVSRWDIVRKLATEQSYAEYLSDYHHYIGDSKEYEQLETVSQTAKLAASRLATATVKDVMSHSPLTVAPDDSASHVARLLVDRRIHRVLVARGDKLEGIITSLDLVRLIADEGAGGS